MAILARKAYTNPSCSTSINMNLHKFMTIGPVYPSADVDSAVPVRVAFNVTRNRYETIASGGAGLTANTAVEAIVHGFTGAKVTFQVGPHAEAVPLFIEAEFGNYSTDTTTNIFQLFLSTTQGALDTVAPYAGAIPCALRFGYNSKLGDKLYVNVHGARFGQF